MNKKYSCGIYTERPSVCRKYPFLEKMEYFKEKNIPLNEGLDNQYLFESCQYVENNKIIESTLSQIEQENYCMDCGLCCFYTAPLEELKNNSNVISEDLDEEWSKPKNKCQYLEIIENN
jgi:Fe-S-cluster containining protein